MLAFILRRLAGTVLVLLDGVGLRVRLRAPLAGRSRAPRGRTRCDRGGRRGGARRAGPRRPALASISRITSAQTVRGDFGRSARTRQPVVAEIGARFMPTLWLTLVAMGWSTVAGIGDRRDLRRASAGAGKTRPPWCSRSRACPSRAFWLGLLLIDLFSVRLGWLPTGGYDELAKLRAALDHARRRRRGGARALHPLGLRRGRRRGLCAHRARRRACPSAA